jgi:hypothetical protein
MRLWIIIALSLFLVGCAPEPVPTIPDPPIKSVKSDLTPDSNPPTLTEEQREELTKQLKANKRLLIILEDVEKQIKSKQRKADFFGFALSDDDEITLEASKILLSYFKKTKQDIRNAIKDIEKSLGPN